jgi:hypothetical protein
VDRRFLGIAALASALATIVAPQSTALAASSDPGPDFGPSATMVATRFDVVDHERLLVNPSDAGDRTMRISWRGPNRYRDRMDIRSRFVDNTFTTDVLGAVTLSGGGLATGLQLPTRSVNTTPVEPDAEQRIDALLMGDVWPLVARMRSGEPVLRLIRSDGRTLLRGTVVLAPDECSDRGRGERTIDLDPRTLLPMRVVERRGGRVQHLSTLRYLRGVPRLLPPVQLAYPPFVLNDGYVRTSPAVAAAATDIDVRLPQSLPAGMVLTASGHARRSEDYGSVEASFPRGPVFFARWSRGLEQLHLTIRRSTPAHVVRWRDSDPFGDDCLPDPTTEQVQVGAATARFAIGERGNARLWWVDGTSAFTLSGPFSADQLVAIAESLESVDDGG